MLMKFIYIFFIGFVIFTLGLFLLLLPSVFLLKFFLNNVSDIDWLLTKEAWNLFFQALWKEVPFNLSLSIAMGIVFAGCIMIEFLVGRSSIVPDLRTRCIGLGILAVFMASLFFLAKYYGLIPLKNAFA